MTNRAAFTIEGNASANRGYDVSASTSYTLALEASPPGVLSASFVQLAKSKGAGDLTWPGGQALNPVTSTIEVVVPAGTEIESWTVLCTVTYQSNGVVVSESFGRILAKKSGAVRAIVPGESGEYDPTYGWTGSFSAVANVASAFDTSTNMVIKPDAHPSGDGYDVTVSGGDPSASTKFGGDVIVDLGTPVPVVNRSATGAAYALRASGVLWVKCGAAGNFAAIQRGQAGVAGGGTLRLYGANYGTETGDPGWRVILPQTSVLDLTSYSSLACTGYMTIGAIAGSCDVYISPVAYAKGVTIADGGTTYTKFVATYPDTDILIGVSTSTAAGRTVKVQAGDGAAGNNAGGNIELQVGARTGSGAEGKVSVKDSGGTERFFLQYLSSPVYAQIGGIPTLALGGAGCGTVIVNPSSTLACSTNTINFAPAVEMVFGNGTNAGFSRIRHGSATISSATTTTLISFTTSSDRSYQVIVPVTVRNVTDGQAAMYYMRAGFKNVGGTVTQVGATQFLGADLEDAGQTGLSCTIDFSGTAIRIGRFTTDSTDSVVAAAEAHIYEAST
jgi:hypothetical protein